MNLEGGSGNLDQSFFSSRFVLERDGSGLKVGGFDAELMKDGLPIWLVDVFCEPGSYGSEENQFPSLYSGYVRIQVPSGIF